MTKETILRLLEVDSVKECDGNVFEALAEMRYRYELERKAIKAYVKDGDEFAIKKIEEYPTHDLEQAVKAYEEYILHGEIVIEE